MFSGGRERVHWRNEWVHEDAVFAGSNSMKEALLTHFWIMLCCFQGVMTWVSGSAQYLLTLAFTQLFSISDYLFGSKGKQQN